jgi:hypothetical protein
MTGISMMSRSKLFIDTGGFIALANERDQYHKVAASFYRQLDGGIIRVTSNLVISETYTFLRYRIGYSVAMRYLLSTKKAQSGGYLQILFSNEKSEEQALKILEKYNDHDISYVDAVSFGFIMSDARIDRVLTFDRHFLLIGREIVPQALGT